MICICSRNIFIVLQIYLFMNQEQRLVTQLSQLKDILDDAKAILEWHKLKVFEKSSNPSLKVFLQDDTFHQLTDKQAAFQMLWARTSTLLKDKTIKLGQDKRIEFQKDLNKLSLQFFYLGSDVRIYWFLWKMGLLDFFIRRKHRTAKRRRSKGCGITAKQQIAGIKDRVDSINSVLQKHQKDIDENSALLCSRRSGYT